MPADKATFDEYDEAAARRLYEYLEQRPVQLTLRGYSAWILFNTIQLSYSHPGIGDSLKERLVTLGRTIQQTWNDDPWVSALAEKGWDRAYDVPVDRHGKSERCAP